MKKIIIISIAVIVVLLVSIFSITIVPTGYVGVKTRFGAVEDKVYNEGIHFKMIIKDRIIKINTKVQRVDTEGEGASKDLQTVNLYITTNYRVNREKAAEIYKKIGKNYEENIIRPVIQEVSKATVSTFTAEELITNRSAVSNLMLEMLNEKINEKGFYADNINIVNLQFSEAYNSAIEQKQVAEQEVKKAQLELEKTKVEAEKKIVEADAEKRKMELLNQELNDKILKSEAIKKWNGELPNAMTNDVLKILQ